VRPSPLAAVLGLVLALAGGCVSTADPTAELYHHGEIVIGTGNTTGTFYEIGAGFADVVNRHLPGYEGISAATNGSVENLTRLASGDIDVALVFASNAAEALNGQAPFAGKAMPVRAIARLYRNYTHLAVRTASGITSVAGLRGHRVAISARNSGSEATALRILGAAGLTPGKDVTTVNMSLPQETAAMLAGTVDAMFYSAGLPVAGITDLITKGGGTVRLLPLDSVLPALAAAYGDGVYFGASIPKATYGLAEEVPTVAESNLLVVSASMPASLVYQLTRLLFAYQSELAKVHPAANDIQRDTAMVTDPVPLHPGASRYYNGG
jgi:uncharacterized protein